MPRQSRQLSESKTYHVIIRGNARNNIFLDEKDKVRFLDILAEKNKERKHSFYAYCLMDNHVHLLINEGTDEISRIMQRINGSYAYYFNKKYSRVGHVFQDRFKSESIDDDRYLLAAVRYIHNNPVKAHLVKNPVKYNWSSYKSYITENSVTNLLDTSFILGIFADDEQTAIVLFDEFSQQMAEENFIDCQDDATQKALNNEQEVIHFINYFCIDKRISLDEIKQSDNIAIRDELILKLKNQSSLSVRYIANILGIGRNIVQRVKKQEYGLGQ